MTIKTSGVLSFQDILDEPHNYGSDLGSYYYQNWWTDDGGYGRFIQNTLNFEYFYGKRFTPPFACGTGIVQIIGQQRQCPGVNTYYLPGIPMDVFEALDRPVAGTWVVIPVYFGTPDNYGKDSPGFFTTRLPVNQVVEVYLQIGKPANYISHYLLPNASGVYNVPYNIPHPYSDAISFGTGNTGLRYNSREQLTSRVFPENFSFYQNEAALVKWDTGTTNTSFQHVYEVEWDGYTARPVARAWGYGGIYSDTISMGICGAAIFPGVGSGPRNPLGAGPIQNQGPYIENGPGYYEANPDNSGRYKTGLNCLFTELSYSTYMGYTDCPATTHAPRVYVPDPCPVVDSGPDSGTGDPNQTGGTGTDSGTDGSGTGEA